MGDIAGTAATRRIPGYARKKDFLRRRRNSATLCGKDNEERIVGGLYSIYVRAILHDIFTRSVVTFCRKISIFHRSGDLARSTRFKI